MSVTVLKAVTGFFQSHTIFFAVSGGLHRLFPVQHPGAEDKEQEHDQQKGRKTPGSHMLGNESKDHRRQHDTGVGESHFHADNRLRGFYTKKYRSEMGHVWELRPVSQPYEK